MRPSPTEPRPATPGRRAVAEAELGGTRCRPSAHGRPAQQRHADLRAEAGRQPQRVAHRVGAALREVELARARDRPPGSSGPAGRCPSRAILTATTSSSPTPIGWPVKPLVLAITIWSASAPKTRAQRVDLGRGAAAAGRGVGLVRDEDRLGRHRVARRDAARLGLARPASSITPRDVLDVEPRAVEGAVGGDRAEHLADGLRCRARAPRRRSRPRAPAAPMPMIMPWRRRSKGSAASSTTSSVAAAPVARKPAPIHSSRWSEVTSSAATTTTRRQRPARIQSSASATAWVVLAQAELICVFGPRAPMSSANCEWPIESTRNRKRRSNAYGSRSSSRCELGMRRSISARATLVAVTRERTRLAAPRVRCLRGRGRRSSGSSSSANASSPGKAEAKMTPVSSRSASGSTPAVGQLRARAWSSCSAGRAGCPRRAARRCRRRWRAACRASSAGTRSASMPNSSAEVEGARRARRA